MIMTLVGTGPDPFDRLIRPLDELAGKKDWDVFIQLGHTRYEPTHCRFERFMAREALLQKIQDADLVITQGGYGGIRDALQFNKPIVAVPRYPSLGESPDHQDEMVRAMEQKGYVIALYDIADLETAIESARNFTPSPRIPSAIPGMLAGYVTRHCQ